MLYDLAVFLQTRTAVRRGVRLALSVLVVALLPLAARAQVGTETFRVEYLKRLTIEELATLDVISASRREQPYWKTAAAVHVLTEEDIRRSGARSIPEALRLAPGLQVARATSRSW